MITATIAGPVGETVTATIADGGARVGSVTLTPLTKGGTYLALGRAWESAEVRTWRNGDRDVIWKIEAAVGEALARRAAPTPASMVADLVASHSRLSMLPGDGWTWSESKLLINRQPTYTISRPGVLQATYVSTEADPGLALVDAWQRRPKANRRSDGNQNHIQR